MKLTPHEQKVLDLVKQYPDIVSDPAQRKEVAEAHGLTEKTLRNRIADLKKYGLIENVTNRSSVPVRKEKRFIIEEGVRLVEEDRVKPLWRLLRTIFIHRWKLLGFNVLVGLAAVGILLILPEWYRGTAVAVIQQQESDRLGSVVSTAINVGLGIPQGNEAAKYIAYLKSRRVLDKVIEKFDLFNVYKQKYKDDVYNELLKNCTFTDNDDGTLSISCLYKEDPQKAAEMANYFYDCLYELAMEIEQISASNYRDFIERSYFIALDSLHSLEERFKSFQKQHGLYNVDEQVKVAINHLAELESEKVAMEIEYDFLSFQRDSDRPELVNLAKKLDIIKNKINQLRSDDEYVEIPLENIPENSMLYLRFYRDILIQEKITDFLALKLEEAKLDERKNSIDIYLLDKAVPGDKKAWPPRTVYLLITMFLSGIVSILYFRIKDLLKERSIELKNLLFSK
jgi:capsule polysaccharide export protein KpsE/RkpR